jgi:thiol-disulfide isomerase/thioredoxin
MSSELYYQKYIKYKTKYNNLKTNTQMGGSTQKEENTQKTDIYFFKANWCGHCKNFSPIWEALESELGTKYNFNTIDVDDIKNEKILEKYKKYIQGYPTIIKKVGDTINLFNGERNVNNVREFITESN